MKQFLIVFSFELRQKFKEKSYLIALLISAVLAFGVTLLPKILDTGEMDDVNQGLVVIDTDGHVVLSDEEKITMGLVYMEGVDPSVKEILAEAYEITEFKDEEEMKKAVLEGKLDQGAVIVDNITANVYLAQSSFGENEDYNLANILRDNFKYNIALKDSQVDKSLLRELDQVYASAPIRSLGTNPFVGYILSYFLVFLLYIMILMHGQSIATSVAREKDNRTMELLVTNVRPKAMIWGKVMSGLVASMVQLICMALGFLVGFLVNIGTDGMTNEIVQMVLEQVGLVDVVVFLGFGLVGVTLYYFIYASLGSLVSRLDEMNQALAPVTTMIMIAFIVPVSIMTFGDTVLLKVLSFIPFTSMLAMFIRFQMTTVPIIEVLISFVILVATTVLVGFASSKIYRNGTLNYGNRLNLWKAFTSKAE